MPVTHRTRSHRHAAKYQGTKKDLTVLVGTHLGVVRFGLTCSRVLGLRAEVSLLSVLDAWGNGLMAELRLKVSRIRDCGLHCVFGRGFHAQAFK